MAEHFAEQFEGREAEVGDALYGLQKEVMRRHIIDEGVRPDGRKLTEVRPIWCETGILPRPHGSAVFTRGQTQVLTTVTLGASGRRADSRRHQPRGFQALYAPLQFPAAIPRAKPSPCAARAAAKSATARWRSARWSR